VIKIKGQKYDLTVLAQQAYSQLATVSPPRANRLWADDWDLDAIIITGGGVTALAPFLRQQIEGEVRRCRRPDARLIMSAVTGSTASILGSAGGNSCFRRGVINRPYPS